MSRIGRLPVAVPASVQNVTIEDRTVTVTGPKGEVTHEAPAPLTVARDDEGNIVVSRPDDEQENRALHGLTRTLINNIVLGVRGHHLRRRVADQVLGQRHLEAAGRARGREDPRDPSAGALQGQGRAVRRRGRAPQGRKGW